MQLKDRKTQVEAALIKYSNCAVSFEIVRRSVPDLAAEQNPQIKGYHWKSFLNTDVDSWKTWNISY